MKIAVKFLRFYFKYFLVIMLLIVLSVSLFSSLNMSQETIHREYGQFTAANNEADYLLIPDINKLKNGESTIYLSEYDNYESEYHTLDFSRINNLLNGSTLTKSETDIFNQVFTSDFIERLQSVNNPGVTLYYTLYPYVYDALSNVTLNRDGQAEMITVNYAKMILNACLNENNMESFMEFTLDNRFLNPSFAQKYHAIVIKNTERMMSVSLIINHQSEGTQVKYTLYNYHNDVNTPYVVSSLNHKNTLDLQPGEIAIFPEFAKQNHIQLGDTLTINGTDYRVMAFIYQPDIIFPVNLRNYYFNGSTDTYVAMNSTDLSQTSDTNSSIINYYLKFNPGVNQQEELSRIEQDSNIVSTENIASNTFIQQNLLSMNYIETCIPLLLFMITATFYGIFVNRKLMEHRNEILTLHALGYSKKTILGCIGLFTLMLTLLSAVAGLVLGYFMNLFILHTYYQILYMPHLAFAADFSPLSIGITIISVTLILISIYSASKLFKKTEMSKKTFFIKNQISRFHFGTVAALAAFALLFAFMSYGVIHDYNLKFREIYSAQELVYFPNGIGLSPLDAKTCQGNDVCQAVVSVKMNVIYANRLVPVNLEGINHSLTLEKVTDNQNQSLIEKADDNSAIITRLLADDLGLKTGDTLEIQSNAMSTDGTGVPCSFNLNATCSLVKLKIAGITENDAELKVYTTIPSVNRLYFGDDDHDTNINAMYTNFDIYSGNVPKKLVQNIAYVFYFQSFFQGLEQSFTIMNVLLVISSLILTIISTVLLSVIGFVKISEFRDTITVFKAMGYKNKEITLMLFKSYPLILIAAFLITLPLSQFVTGRFYYQLGKSFGKLFLIKLSPFDAISAFVIVVVIATFSFFVADNFVRRVPVAEQLNK